MGVYLGKVVSYKEKLYRVCYEDGDAEDLEFREVRGILIAKGADFGYSPQLVARKERLDGLAGKVKWDLPLKEVVLPAEPLVVASGVSSEAQNENEDEDENENENENENEKEEEEEDEEEEEEDYVAPLPEPLYPALPLELPPSTGELGVPEESVSYLFSVYNFLRSFSHLIFLSPFSLDSFVGSLNCNTQNTLSDAVHVCLMRALRRHLQVLSSEGDELAAKCLSQLDWNLLDVLTWPVFLVEFFFIMGYSEGAEEKAFQNHVLGGEYHSLSVGVKLRVLQILCDSVLDSAEVRAEIDARESEEAEIGADESFDLHSEIGPKRVHPRYAKTSASRDAVMAEINAGSEKTALLSSNVGKDAVEANAADDGNSDECKLCGMDGILLCCDGCPSAYHSRCIGLSKAHLPNGMWFCPECAMNKMHPTCARIGMGVRGAEVFGVDPYGRAFLGNCSYLVVIDLEMSGKPICRYFSSSVIPKILLLLYTVEYAPFYSVICAAILQYWNLSEDQRFIDLQKHSVSLNLSNGNGNEIDVNSADLSHNSICSVDKAIATKSLREDGPCPDKGSEVLEILTTPKIESKSEPSNLNGEQFELDEACKLISPMNSSGPEVHTEPRATVSLVPNIISANSSDVIHQNLGKKLRTIDLGHKEDFDGGKLQENVGILKLGTSFKPQAYINQYIHGDVAASAAANLAVLTSESGKPAEVIASSDSKKITAENVSLQAKAFSEVALYFQWPTAERRLLEIPRERCGWCIGCKAPPSRKMRCMLNSTALNAVKCTARGLGNIRILKIEEGILSSIAAYILLMEESLQGLLIGSLRTTAYRNQWRRHLEVITDLNSLKYHLLELEENIYKLAFSTGWLKLVDDLSVDSFTVQGGNSISGLPPKRGRKKKQGATSEENLDPCPDWWRGCKIGKLIFYRNSIPCANSRKAGRQSGSKKIPGISYGEEIPKRIQRFAWRAAVERGRSASQLALQVRYLDSQIRWGDIVRPDQVPHEGKGSDIEVASAFRNAIICGKEIMERKTTYALSFADQKHLPSRLMKNIVNSEKLADGKEKKWFSENHVPLYLIKEYEEKAVKDPSALCHKMQFFMLKPQLMKLKAYNLKVDIFPYLRRKADQLIKNSCISCQLDVFLRHAVICYGCQGLCHKGCLLPSVASMRGEICPVFLCNKCYHAKLMASNGFVKPKEHLSEPITSSINDKKRLNATSDSASLRQSIKKPLKVKKPGEQNNLGTVGTSAFNSSKKRKNLISKYGLIWKQGKFEANDDAESFRHKNILLKCSSNVQTLERPLCFLCHQPYDPDLIYIRCEDCKNWYHADAVQLQESQISELKGFKCCKCRRRTIPVCPYKKLVIKLGKKQELIENTECSPTPFSFEHDDSNSEANRNSYEVVEEDVFGDDDATLLSSFGMDEPFSEWNDSIDDCSYWDVDVPFFQSAQKLPVRRHMKHGQNASSSNVEMTYNDAADNEFHSLPEAEWNFEMMNFDEPTAANMEFEPQTYFSYQELLASEDDHEWRMFNADAPPTELGYDWVDTMVACPDNSFLERPGMVPSCLQCGGVDPAPELSCVKCNMRIHKHCSPWLEQPSLGNNGWECGGCRRWM